MKFKMLFIVTVLGLLHCNVYASTFTNLALPKGQMGSQSVNVKTGQVARVTSGAMMTGGKLTVTMSGVSFDYLTGDFSGGPSSSSGHTPGLPTIAGPATITLSTDGSYAVFCSIEISSAEQLTPSTAVVIPADSGGPVNIILESSIDLITWTSALPGTYGTSTEKRFFRVRAERNP